MFQGIRETVDAFRRLIKEPAPKIAPTWEEIKRFWWNALAGGRPFPDDPSPSPYESVDHPHHYNTGDIEHCEKVEDHGFADGYYYGQVTKYLDRMGSKPNSDPVEDLRKAQWYLNRWIDWRTRGKEIWKIQKKP